MRHHALRSQLAGMRGNASSLSPFTINGVFDDCCFVLDDLEATARRLAEALEELLGHALLPGEKPLKGVEASVEKARAALTAARAAGLLENE